MLTQAIKQRSAAEHFIVWRVDECLSENSLGFIEVFLELDGVVDPVVPFLKELFVLHVRTVLEVQHACAFDESMGHEGACGHDGLHPSLFDHLAEHQPLLGDGHCAGDGDDTEAVGIIHHGFENIGCFSEPTAPKSGGSHCADEVVHTVNLVEIEWGQGFQAIIVACAVSLLVAAVRHGSPRD